MNVKALSTKWKPPYRKNHEKRDVSNFPHLRQGRQAGVYLISDAAGDIVYIGFSANQLYKTLYRHFETWNDRRQARNTYDRNTHQVRVIYTTPKRAGQIEMYLVNKLKPRDNINLYMDFPAGKLTPGKDVLDNTEYIEPSDICPF